MHCVSVRKATRRSVPPTPMELKHTSLISILTVPINLVPLRPSSDLCFSTRMARHANDNAQLNTHTFQPLQCYGTGTRDFSPVRQDAQEGLLKVGVCIVPRRFLQILNCVCPDINLLWWSMRYTPLPQSFIFVPKVWADSAILRPHRVCPTSTAPSGLCTLHHRLNPSSSYPKFGRTVQSTLTSLVRHINRVVRFMFFAPTPHSFILIPEDCLDSAILVLAPLAHHINSPSPVRFMFFTPTRQPFIFIPKVWADSAVLMLAPLAHYIHCVVQLMCFAPTP